MDGFVLNERQQFDKHHETPLLWKNRPLQKSMTCSVTLKRLCIEKRFGFVTEIKQTWCTAVEDYINELNNTCSDLTYIKIFFHFATESSMSVCGALEMMLQHQARARFINDVKPTSIFVKLKKNTQTCNPPLRSKEPSKSVLLMQYVNKNLIWRKCVNERKKTDILSYFGPLFQVIHWNGVSFSKSRWKFQI